LMTAKAIEAASFERMPSTDRPSPIAKSAHGLSAAAKMLSDPQ
jgi:hypothetical protein